MPQQIMSASFNQVVPLYSEPAPAELAFNVAAGLTLSAGQLVLEAASNTNDVQTLTVTGTPTGGTITISGNHPINLAPISFTVNYNSTVAQTQAALNAALGQATGSGGTNLITVGGGTLPGATQTFTGSGDAVSRPLALMTVSATALTGGTSPAASIAHTTTGTTQGAVSAYSGSGTPVGVLRYDTATDGFGNVVFGTSATAGGEHQQFQQTAPVWVKGDFSIAELIGLDANAVTARGLIVLSGSVASGAGLIRFT